MDELTLEQLEQWANSQPAKRRFEPKLTFAERSAVLAIYLRHVNILTPNMIARALNMNVRNMRLNLSLNDNGFWNPHKQELARIGKDEYIRRHDTNEELRLRILRHARIERSDRTGTRTVISMEGVPVKWYFCWLNFGDELLYSATGRPGSGNFQKVDPKERDPHTESEKAQYSGWHFRVATDSYWMKACDTNTSDMQDADAAFAFAEKYVREWLGAE